MNDPTPLLPRLPRHAQVTIHRFLRAHCHEAHAHGVLLGLSGGIDSAVTARLCVDALGAKAVSAVLLPDRGYPSELLGETRSFAHDLGIESETIPIDGPEDAFRAVLGESTDLAGIGNVKARIRMALLYARARERGALVVGTGNKSEILLGYFTKWGDGGVDLLPLGDLYKTEVRELAALLSIPEPILLRAPTAGLWPGQTDEEELGHPYELLDRVLRGLEELRGEEEIAGLLGVPIESVHEISERVARYRHKRRTPPIPKLSLRTIGIDWRD